MFDPESVERWDIFPDGEEPDFYYAEKVGSQRDRHPAAQEFVCASDYDQLLALWREQAKQLLECYAELGMV